MRKFILFTLACSGLLPAQESPYNKAPTAVPPYYRVRYEASEEAGQLAYPVQYTLWVPPGVETLRGVVVHQHGCGVGSCSSGLTGAFDLHWQALAQKHQCALIAPAYEQPEEADCQLWCDPRNGSAATFQKSLTDLGKLSNHPELAKVPWALWGHSGGGHWAGGMVMLDPERIAAAWLRSGVPLLVPDPTKPNLKPHLFPDGARQVPLMCNLGTKEGVTDTTGRFSGVWPANETFLSLIILQGGLIGLAIDPLTAHECGNQRYLAIPWFDACLTARLPEPPATTLKPMARKVSRTMPLLGGLSIWLPSKAVDQAWVHYTKDTQIPDTTPPPAPTNLQVKNHQLTWDATADLESGLAHFIIIRDGKEIATVPEKPQSNFGRPLFQGLQYSDTPKQPLAKMQFTDPKPEPGKKHQYRVITVNTAGLRSP